jgi:hypothetical protein
MTRVTVQKVTLVINVTSLFVSEKMQKNQQFVLDMEIASIKMFVHATLEKQVIDVSTICVMA